MALACNTTEAYDSYEEKPKKYQTQASQDFLNVFTIQRQWARYAAGDILRYFIITSAIINLLIVLSANVIMNNGLIPHGP